MSTAWPSGPLGDVCEIYQPKTISQKEMMDDGKYPVFGANGIIGRYDKFNHEDPQLLITCRGATCGSVNISKPFSWVTGNAMVVRPKNEKLNLKFVEYFFRGAIDFSAVITGAAQPQITRKSLAPVTIPLPPLDEQKRIVAVLDQAFAALDRASAHAEANLADAGELLSSFVEAQLETSGGQTVTLQEMLDQGLILSHLDGNHGSDYPKKAEFVESGVPYISANCIVGDEIDLSRAKYLSPGRAERMRKGVAQDRDVIFAHNATVGPVALLRTSEDKVILSTSVTYYRADESRVAPEFLMYEMRGAKFQKQCEAVMRQATRNQVPITAQRKFSHTLPEIAVQRKIANVCSEVESHARSLLNTYANQLEDIAELRQSLLQKAFSGQLT